MALPAAAGAAGSPFDLVPHNLSAASAATVGQQVATAPNGTSTVTWSRYDGSNTIVQAVRINANGYVGPIFNLSAPGQNADSPQVATSPNGTSTITWSRYDGSNAIVQAVRIDAKGKKGPILNLSTPGQGALEQQVATAPNGASTITWSRYDGGAYVIQAVRIDAKGKKGTVLNLSAFGQGANAPQVATAPNGASTITWNRFDGSNSVVQAVRIDAKGKKGPILNLSATGQNSEQQQVATAPNGASTITWRRGGGLNFVVQAVRIDAKGKKGPLLNVSASGPGALDPQVATAPNGTSTIAWQGKVGSNYLIQAVRIDAKGNKRPIIDLSPPNRNARDAQLATAPNGTSTITWRLYDGSNRIVQAARIDPAGWLSPVLDLSAPDRTAYGPQVATAPNGTSTIAWQIYDGSKYSIQAVLLR